MIKKRDFFIYLFLVIAVFTGGIFFVDYLTRPGSGYRSSPFCNQSILNRQKYYEDDLVMGLYNIRPMVEGHCLIITKRHVERFDGVSSEEMLAMMNLIKKTHSVMMQKSDKKDYLLIQKNGVSVGQSVFHIHFHYIPRKETDFSRFFFLMRFLIAPFKHNISQEEMDRQREFLSHALSCA